MCLAKNIFANLFYYSTYFCYYLWVSLHFLVLFIGSTILFQITFTFIYSTFSKKKFNFNKISEFQKNEIIIINLDDAYLLSKLSAMVEQSICGFVMTHIFDTLGTERTCEKSTLLLLLTPMCHVWSRILGTQLWISAQMASMKNSMVYSTWFLANNLLGALSFIILSVLASIQCAGALGL